MLDRIANFGDDATRPPLIVLDLDATLYDNRPRTLQILLEYAEAVRDESPDVASALGTLDASRVQYLLSDTLRGCALTQSEVIKDVTGFWRDRFFTDDYVRFDTPMDGAPEFVRACHEAGAIIVYLTGRDIPGMLLGTVESLRDSGFPVGVAGVECVLKPDATLPDEAFKRTALPTLARVGDVVAFFDNEPANCNVARQLFGDAHIVLVDTQRVPGAPDLTDGVETITDFRIV